MRHANPEAVTILLSAFPDMTAAARAIVLQADEIVLRMMDLSVLSDSLRNDLPSELFTIA
jgi:hypothetical protein